MSDHYILKGHEPVEEPDLLRWGKWFGTADRHVALSIQGDVRVSTVFLGLDYSFGDGPPLLFETMAFVGDEEQGCERYSTWDEAEAGHRRWVAEIFKPTPILTLPTTGGA
jgi:hypothetical protein